MPSPELSPERLRGLLDAVVSMASDLEVDSVLQRIVRAACQQADAKYGALGVLEVGARRGLSAFVTEGLTDAQRKAIGLLPHGHGLLGVVIDSPEPLRLTSISDHPQSFGFPANHPPMDTFLGVPIRIRGKVFGNLYLTEKQSGQGFTQDDEAIVVALAAAAGVVIENARLYEESARRQRWLEAAAEFTTAILSDADLNETLAEAAARACEIADAKVASVLLRHDAERLLVEATAGDVSADVDGTRISTTGTVAGTVLELGECIVIEDTTRDDRLELLGLSTLDGWPELASIALWPLRTGQTSNGILLLGWSTDQASAFARMRVVHPAFFAEQLGLALQASAAQEDRQRLAVLEDRDRIGRDLHDLVIQRLFAVGLMLENTGRSADNATTAERVARAVDDIDETIKDIRHTIFELSSRSQLASVTSEIEQAVAMVAPVLGFTPEVIIEGPVDSEIDGELRLQILAVVRETLSNVARHANASQAVLALQVGAEISLTVFDDGDGVVGGARGNGLDNMAARARALGGSFELTRTADNSGTVAAWRVPLKAG